MTDKNAAWAAAYGAEFAILWHEQIRSGGVLNAECIADIKAHSQSCADAAVADLEEPKPEAGPFRLLAQCRNALEMIETCTDIGSSRTIAKQCLAVWKAVEVGDYLEADRIANKIWGEFITSDPENKS